MKFKKTEVTLEQLKSAYLKYKAYIYHDTTELFQRQKLADFEAGIINYKTGIGKQIDPKSKFELKFTRLLELINDHNDEGINKLLNEIKLIYLPKSFENKNEDKNYISNQRISDSYNIEKVTVFVDVPVELHLVTVLWIMKYGYKLDAKLDPSCFGNRLILNGLKDGVIKGSGLFKPYFNQYQKWRDTSVNEAERKLELGSDVAFINLDLQNFFYSAKIDFSIVENEIWGVNKYKKDSRIHEIFKKLYVECTNKVKETNYPNKELYENLGDRCILPIGLASSYVLGNYYLHDFDKKLKKLIPQINYSRYVDDILIVVENPNFNFGLDGECKSTRFSFDSYLKEVRSDRISINFDIDEISKSERFILETFYPLFTLVDAPKTSSSNDSGFDDEQSNKNRIFKISCLDDAVFQPSKTLIYYFDHNEATTVIDKLKKDLEDKASEFRDFPEDSEFENSFDDQAYHLIYDGTEGKIRTLKDYRENRYGLSVYLSNRIFVALRSTKKVDVNESEKLLKLFRGLNNLEYFRLWEKIFTFFLANDNRNGFVKFFKQTIIEILKLNSNSTQKILQSTITHKDVATSLLRYFDISFEMPLALNPGFIKKDSSAYKDIEIFVNTYQIETLLYNGFSIQSTERGRIERFRISNLIRHHFVAHPLINYTKESSKNRLNLASISLPRIDANSNLNFDFVEHSTSYSPRRVKFWECCIAVINFEMLRCSSSKIFEIDDRYQKTKLFTDSKSENDFILNKAYVLYDKINNPHFSTHRPKKDDFFKRYCASVLEITSNKKIEINEIHVNKERNFKENPKISVANTQVHNHNIEASIKNSPNLHSKRYNILAQLLKSSRVEQADLFVLPEFSVPYEYVPMLAKYSDKNQMAIIAGLEHWNLNDVVYNFIVSIIPVKVNGLNDCIVLFRLKNHYAHIEELIIRGFGYKVPKPVPYRYDLINWRNLYFTSFYCFELADSHHRSIFRSKLDLLIASEWNKDIPYFSNIVEALSRDLHCYIAQVNTSQFGDSRLTQPTDSAKKDLLKLKGGNNNTVLVEEMNIQLLRDFQLKHFERIKADNDTSFKPLPPDWDRTFVKKRIKNANIFESECDDG